MSKLENHRKRAKRVLRWHRERHWPVAAQIREHLHEFDGLSDRQVFASNLKLTQAQTVVARQAGFESWDALKRSCDAASSEPSSGAASVATLTKVIPFLWISDIPRTCAYFETALGFDLDFTYGEPPFYAEVEREGIRFALRHVDTPAIRASLDDRHREELPAATVEVDRAKPLFKEFDAAGADFYQRLRTEAWGARSFIVEDPDGNLIVFMEPAPQSNT